MATRFGNIVTCKTFPQTLRGRISERLLLHSFRHFEMSLSSYDAVAEKVLFDLELAIKKHPNIDEFYIIPTPEEENKNSSPVIKGENTLGLESWIVTHIYPYAHHQIMQKSNYKMQNLSKVIPCLTGVALLNPEMPTVWSRRRELIISQKLLAENELRLTRMALSRKPKCNDALTHRRWIITEMMKDTQDKLSLLAEELKLSEMIANRYHSNYHAWSHRMWCIEHLIPEPVTSVRRKGRKNRLFESMSIELMETMRRPIGRNENFFVKNSEVWRIYFEELENNFKWVSSHVSDHSGLHFRKFLITEILSFMESYLSTANKMEIENDLEHTCTKSQCNLIPHILKTGKINLGEFLSSFDSDSPYKGVVSDYLSNLEQELTLFDIAMFLIVTELKSNYSLSVVFLSHEALWCYRRFLIFVYKQLIDSLDHGRERAEHKLFLHLDKNGVPFRKDCKYDNVGDSEIIPKHSNLYVAFYKRLLSNEEAIILNVNAHNDHVKCLVKNYSHWLRHCFNEHDIFL